MCNPKEIFIIVAGNNDFFSVELDVLLLPLLYSHYFVLLMVARLLYVQVKWLLSDGGEETNPLKRLNIFADLVKDRLESRAYVFASHTHGP